tara:strand:- start:122 stop:913 length:792 start_codon:yes stop_codon:yes gene_type:complete
MFYNEKERKINSEYLKNGYIIRDIPDKKSYKKVLLIIENIIKSKMSLKNNQNIFDNTHKFLKKSELNKFRVNLISKMNSNKNFRKLYYQIFKPYLDYIAGNELAMQNNINLSIQLPKDESSLLDIHADTWSGDSSFEVVAWLPLVDCYKTKSMYILPPKETGKLLKSNFLSDINNNNEKLFKKIKNKIKWLNIKKGQMLIFNQNLPHGNRKNLELDTRWSMNCRFKSIFSPYSAKKLGEFFEPINLKPASRDGLNYKLPNFRR